MVEGEGGMEGVGEGVGEEGRDWSFPVTNPIRLKAFV